MEVDQALLKQFHETVAEMARNVDPYANSKITADKIYHPALLNNRKIFQHFLNLLLLPSSSIQGKENLKEFYENFKQGASSLILSEHKSNFDVPVFFAMMYRESDPVFAEIFEKIIFVAGRKLNEEEIFVKLMAEQFHRVIVVPKSETLALSEEEQQNALLINMNTQKFIRENRKESIFLVYPTGTRSKPWDRGSYRGIREVFNYLKNFDQVVFMSTNGNCMKPRQAAMSAEPPRKDQITLVFSKPLKTKEFVAELKSGFQESQGDFKQFCIDQVMDRIYSQKGIMPWDEQ